MNTYNIGFCVAINIYQDTPLIWRYGNLKFIYFFYFFFIPESREKIKKIKDDLSSCKKLLHCKRDELRRLWIDGVEQKTIAGLLDQM